MATRGVTVVTASSRQASGRGGNLPVALGIWFQLKWKSEVLEWIIGVEPLNGLTFL